MNRFPSLRGAALLVVVLAACAAQSPSAGSDEPTSSSAETGPPASEDGGQPSFAGGTAGDLEALIPDTVGDISVTKSSSSGLAAISAQEMNDAVRAFLDDLGVGVEDLGMAVGLGIASDLSGSVSIFVFRAAGADQGRLVAAWKTRSDQYLDEPTVWTPATIAGKSVEASGEDPVNYLYARGDILFAFSGSDPALAEEIAAGLP